MIENVKAVMESQQAIQCSVLPLVTQERFHRYSDQLVAKLVNLDTLQYLVLHSVIQFQLFHLQIGRRLYQLVQRRDQLINPRGSRLHRRPDGHLHNHHLLRLHSRQEALLLRLQLNQRHHRPPHHLVFLRRFHLHSHQYILQ